MLTLAQLNTWGENKLCSNASFAYTPAPSVKVKIARGKDFIVSASSFYQIKAKQKSRIFHQPVQIKPHPAGISINGEMWGEEVRIEPAAGSFCQINQKEYRGIIIIKEDEGTLEVINKLSVEKYLYGLMKLEISPGWALSTLCAQAIVARTYALRKLRKGDTLITSLSQDQVYGGVAAEDPRGRIAVDLTTGEILVYQGNPINALYHACSGGYLTSSKEVWGKDFPYLRAHKDPFSINCPYQKWTVKISTTQLKKMLQEAGFQLKKIKALKIVDKDTSSRAKVLLVSSKQRTQSISGRKLREIIGFNLLRSTLFEVKNRKDEIIFRGRGWGHGVGMSQWGAARMGKLGYSVEEILQFYYPGTEIHKAY